MSWAAQEWKNGLSYRAIQEVEKLEAQLEKRRKECQQKQFQLDSLEQALQNQKKKSDEEKQQKSQIERDYKGVVENFDDLQRRTAKFQHELQVKEAQIEGLQKQLNDARHTVEGETNKGSKVRVDLERLQQSQTSSASESTVTDERGSRNIQHRPLPFPNHRSRSADRPAAHTHSDIFGFGPLPVPSQTRHLAVSSSSAGASDVQTISLSSLGANGARARNPSSGQCNDDLQQTVNKLQKEIDAIKTDKVNLELRIQSRDREIHDLKAKQRELQTDYDRTCYHVTETDKQMNHVKDEVSRLKAQLEQARFKTQADTTEYKRTLEEHKRQEIALGRENEEKNRQIKSLQTQQKDAQAKLERAEQTISDLKLQVKRIETDGEKTKDEFIMKQKEINAQLETMKTKCAELEQYKSETEIKLTGCEEKLTEMNSKNSELERDLSMIRQESHMKEIEARGLMDDNFTLSQKVQNLEARIQDMEAKDGTQLLREEIVKLQAELVNKCEEVLASEKKATDLGDRLQAQIVKADCVLGEYKEKINTRQVEKEELQKRVEELNKSLTEKENEKNSLNQQLVEKQILIETIKADYNEIKIQRDRIESENSELVKKMVGLNVSQMELEKRLDTVQKERVSEKMKIENVVEEIRTNLSQCEEERSRLQLQTGEMAFTLEGQKEDIEQLNNTISQLKLDLENSQTQLSEKLNEYDGLVAEKRVADTDRDELAERLDEVQKQLNEFKQNSQLNESQSKNLIEKMTSQLEEKEKLVIQKDAELKEIGLKLDEVEKSLNFESETANNSKMKTQQLEQQIACLRQDLVRVADDKMTVENEMVALAKERDSHKKMCADLQGQLEAHQTSSSGLISELKRQNEALNESFQKLITEKEELCHSLDNRTREFDGQIKELEGCMLKLEQLQQKVTESTTQVDVLRTEKSALKNKLEEISAQAAAESATVEKLTCELEAERSKSVDLLLENQRKMSDSERALMDKEAELNKVRCLLECNEEDSEVLIAQIEEKDAKIEQLLQQVAGMKSEVEGIAKEKVEVEEHRSILANVIDELKADLDASEVREKLLSDRIETMKAEFEKKWEETLLSTKRRAEEFDLLNDRFDHVLKESNSTCAELEAVRASSESLQQRLAELDGIISKLNAEKAEIQQERDKLADELMSANEEISTLWALTKSASVAQENIVQDMKQQIITVVDEKTKLANELKEGACKMDVVQNELNVMTGLRDKLTEKIGMLEQQLSESKFTVEELKGDRAKLEEELSISCCTTKSLRKELSLLKESRTDHDAKSEGLVAEMKQKIVDLKLQKSSLEYDINSLQFQLENQNEDMASYQAEASKQQVEIEQLKQTLAAVVKERDSIKNNIPELQLEMEKLVADIENEKKDKAELETLKEADSLKSENEVRELMKKIEDLECENSHLNGDFEKLKTEAEIWRIELEDMKIGESGKLIIVENLKLDLEQTKQTLESVQQGHAESLNEREQVSAALEATKNELETLCKESSDRISFLEDSLQCVNGQLKQVSEREISLKEEQALLESQMNENGSLLEQQKKKLAEKEEQFCQIEQACTGLQETELVLKKQIEDLLKVNFELKTDNDLLAVKLSEYEVKLNTEIVNNTNLKESLILTNTIVDKMKVEFKTEFSEMSRNLDAKMAELLAVRMEIDENRKKIDLLQQQISSHEKEMETVVIARDNLRAENTALAEVKASLEGDLEELRKEYSQEKTDLEQMVNALKERLELTTAEKKELSTSVETLEAKLELVQEETCEVRRSYQDECKKGELLVQQISHLKEMEREWETQEASLENERSTLAEHVEKLASELKSTNEKLTVQTSKAEVCIQELEAQVAKLTEKKIACEHEISDMSVKLQNEFQYRYHVQQVMKEKDEKLAFLEQQIAEFGELEEKLLKDKDNALDEMATTGADRDELVKEIHSLKEVLSEKTTKAEGVMEQYQLKISDLETERDALKKRLSDLGYKIDTNMESLSYYNQEVSHASLQAEILNQQCEEYRNSIDRLNQEIEQLNEDKMSLASQSDTLLIKDEELKLSAEKLARSENKCDEFRQRICTLEAELETVRTDLSDVGSQMAQYGIDEAELKDVLKRKDAVIDQMEQHRSSDRDTCERLLKERNDFEEELKQVSMAHDALTRECEILREEKQSLQEKSESYMAEVRSKIESMNAEKSAMETELNEFKSRAGLNRLTAEGSLAEILKRDTEIEQMQSAIQVYEQETQERRAEIAELQNSLTGIQNELQRSQTQINQSEEERTKLGAALNKAKGEKECLHREKTLLQDELDNLKAKFSSCADALDSALIVGLESEEKTQAVEKVQRILFIREQEKEQLIKELERCKEALAMANSSRDELKSMQFELEETINELQSKLSNYDRMKSRLEEINDEKSKFENEMKELRAQCSARLQEQATNGLVLEDQTDETENLRKQLESLAEDHEILIMVKDRLQNDLAILKSETEALVVQKDAQMAVHEELKIRMDILQNEKHSLEDQLFTFKRDGAEASDEQREHDDVINSLKKALETSRQELLKAKENQTLVAAENTARALRVDSLEGHNFHNDGDLAVVRERVTTLEQCDDDCGRHEDGLDEKLRLANEQLENYKKRMEELETELKEKLKLILELTQEKERLEESKQSLIDNLDMVRNRLQEVEGRMGVFQMQEKVLQDAIQEATDRKDEQVALINAQITRVREEVEQHETDNIQLREMTDTLRKKNALLEKENSVLEKRLDNFRAMENERETARGSELEELGVKYEELNDRLSRSEVVHSALKVEAQTLNCKLASLNEELIMKNKKLEEGDYESSKLRQEMENYKNRYNELLSDLNETSEDVQRLADENEALKTENTSLITEKSSLEKMVDELKSLISAGGETNIALQKQIEADECSSVEFNKRVEELTSEMAGCRAEVEQMVAARDASLGRTTELEMELDRVKQKQLQNEDSLRVAELEISNLCKELEETKAQATDSTNLRADVESKLKLVESGKQKLGRELDDSVRQLEIANASLEQVHIKLKILTTEKEMVEKNYESAELDLKRSELAQNNAEKSLCDLEKEKSDLSEKLAEQEDLNHVIQMEASVLQEQVDELEKAVDKFELEKEQSLKMVAQLMNEIEAQKQKARDDECLVSQLQRELINLKNDLKKKQDEKAEVEAELKAETDEVGRVQNELDAKDIEYQEGILKLQKEKNDLHIQFDGARSEINELKSRISDLDGEKSDIQEKCEALNREVTELKESLIHKENLIFGLETSSVEFVEEEAKLHKQFEEKSEQLRDSMKQNVELEERIANFEVEFGILNAERSDLDEKCARLQGELTEVLEELNSFKKEKSETERQITEFAVNIETLEVRLCEILSEKEILNDQVRCSETQIEDMKYQISTLAKANEDFEVVKAALQEQVSRLEGENKTISDEKAEAEKDLIRGKTAIVNAMDKVASMEKEMAESSKKCEEKCESEKLLRTRNTKLSQDNNLLAMKLRSVTNKQTLQGLNELEVEVRTVKQQLEAKENEFETCQKNITELSEERDTLKSKIGFLLTNLKELGKEKERLEEEVEKMRACGAEDEQSKPFKPGSDAIPSTVAQNTDSSLVSSPARSDSSEISSQSGKSLDTKLPSVRTSRLRKPAPATSSRETTPNNSTEPKGATSGLVKPVPIRPGLIKPVPVKPDYTVKTEEKSVSVIKEEEMEVSPPIEESRRRSLEKRVASSPAAGVNKRLRLQAVDDQTTMVEGLPELVGKGLANIPTVLESPGIVRRSTMTRGSRRTNAGGAVSKLRRPGEAVSLLPHKQVPSKARSSIARPTASSSAKQVTLPEKSSRHEELHGNPFNTTSRSTRNSTVSDSQEVKSSKIQKSTLPSTSKFTATLQHSDETEMSARQFSARTLRSSQDATNSRSSALATITNSPVKGAPTADTDADKPKRGTQRSVFPKSPEQSARRTTRAQTQMNQGKDENADCKVQ